MNKNVKKFSYFQCESMRGCYEGLGADSKKKAAFTLAEVLITLGIIGITAAMTLPTLIQKHQEKVLVTKTRKFYSLINQAVLRAINDNGTPDLWGYSSDDTSPLITKLTPYLKYHKFCTKNDTCHNASVINRRNKSTESNFFNPNTGWRTAMQLADGTIVATYFISSDCTGKGAINACAEYIVDVNGMSKPNTYGKDIFMFFLTKNFVVPSGASKYENDETYTSTAYKFNGGCLSESANGWGCAGWVVENGNMDYWHCDDLSWDGKHTCK